MRVLDYWCEYGEEFDYIILNILILVINSLSFGFLVVREKKWFIFINSDENRDKDINLITFFWTKIIEFQVISILFFGYFDVIIYWVNGNLEYCLY